MKNITHEHMIKEGQTGCYGNFDSLPIYNKGRLVGREWHCRECGLLLSEHQMLVLLGEVEPFDYMSTQIQHKMEVTL